MIKCKHCKTEYASAHDFEKDAFMISDGWSWEFVHNCLKENSEKRLTGYEKGELNVNKNFKKVKA